VSDPGWGADEMKNQEKKKRGGDSHAREGLCRGQKSRGGRLFLNFLNRRRWEGSITPPRTGEGGKQIMLAEVE